MPMSMILDRTLSICCPSPCLSVQSSSIRDPLKSALRESRAGLSGNSQTASRFSNGKAIRFAFGALRFC
jgi:hypothetical protein